jgi:outer membrane protein OmpA-like peptidoglycan-associated protein
LDELTHLAGCLQSESYEHLKLLLVGRADHRGDERYNRELALQRAQRVADVLVSQGIDRKRLTVMSRGEAEAIGHLDELASLGHDRRVDLVVMNPVTPGAPARPVH